MKGLLSDIRIVDLTHYLAGPYATMLLADLGAEVIKVEGPDGDPARRVGPPFEPDGFSPYFRAVNHNKKSVLLDLRSNADQTLFMQLIKTADAVVDNFRFGVMQRLGLTHQELSAVNPAVVTCSITAFGETGPYRDLPAFDLVLQAMSGGMSITGEPGGSPTRAGIPLGDLGGGAVAAVAICAAIIQRLRTGAPQHIDIALLDVQVSLLTYMAQDYLTDGRVPQPTGSAHVATVPYQAFQTKDGYIVAGLLGEHFWPKFCRALDLNDLLERYRTNAQRLAARDVLVPMFERVFRSETTATWMGRLTQAGVPAGPVNTIDRVLSDPQVVARGMITSDGGRRILGNPIKTGSVDTYASAPKLGEHTDEILASLRARTATGDETK